MAQSLEDAFQEKLIKELREKVLPQVNDALPDEASGRGDRSRMIKTIASICLAEAIEEQIADWGDDTKRYQYIKDIIDALEAFHVDEAFEGGGWNRLFTSLTKRLRGFNENARNTINRVPDAEQCKVVLGYNQTKHMLEPFNVNSSNINLQTSRMSRAWGGGRMKYLAIRGLKLNTKK